MKEDTVVNSATRVPSSSSTISPTQALSKSRNIEIYVSRAMLRVVYVEGNIYIQICLSSSLF